MLSNVSMHGYGIYIWSSYGLTFLVFSINIAQVFIEKARLKKRLTEKQHES